MFTCYVKCWQDIFACFSSFWDISEPSYGKNVMLYLTFCCGSFKLYSKHCNAIFMLINNSYFIFVTYCIYFILYNMYYILLIYYIEYQYHGMQIIKTADHLPADKGPRPYSVIFMLPQITSIRRYFFTYPPTPDNVNRYSVVVFWLS